MTQDSNTTHNTDFDWSKYPNWLRPDKKHLLREDNGRKEEGKAIDDGASEARP